MHLIKDGDELLGAFVFFVGEEPAYRAIDGKWLTDNTQYGVIHRVASAGKGGFVRRVVEFCEARTDDLRIDTHRDNAPMRGALERLGFVPCGTVIVDDGTERIAYEKVHAFLLLRKTNAVRNERMTSKLRYRPRAYMSF